MTEPSEDAVRTEIDAVLRRARAAADAIEHYDQDQVDELVTAVAWAVVRKDHAEKLAKLAVDEGGFGNYADKVAKIGKRVTGVLADMGPVRTVGVVAERPEAGIVQIAKPVGVVAALIPTTGPDATPPVKALFALKGRNAIVCAPHPRTRQSTEMVVDYMREACRQVGAPEDLVQVVPEPSLAKTRLLMRGADLVVATGGAGMVKAAYSSGTPAYGVGVGNSVHVVDETADLADAAEAIITAKTFDEATSCLADNAVVAHASVYDELVRRLVDGGGHLCSGEQKALLRKAMWPDNGPIPTIDVVAKPAPHIAHLAGFEVPDTCRLLLVEESGTGPGHPFSGEKLSVVLAVYRYEGGIDNAAKLVNDITGYQGLGHTCGIHTSSDENVARLASTTKTARVLVNQNLNEGAGSPRNGLPFTLSLSCGTWGGNITTENVNARHFVNLTWVSRPIPPRVVSEEDLFAAHWQRYGR
ncbi:MULTISPECIES: aldehyde dehydrogenase family protein [Amycolatopsis]|uniref:Aldehyde dehydrogenase family protein n=2 Tax=Amycolatopsis TaxID=1813 RepID=A0A2N3X122_9PSEU|nr:MULTISPECIES: aldehyde dehydrogenase family protein [Amycolatopsis]MBB2505433.1 aldehyde dehydrogenase family protein [Amycolatopsis echigonensis]PKV99810.1 sulfoacetaldehyde dehydrogenase [Amycolatopsis niigatensis]WIV60800.1 aldehyde dehydrogenase family protein [Amycolatopsis sp. 2-2]